jgi:hypothetical protein
VKRLPCQWRGCEKVAVSVARLSEARSPVTTLVCSISPCAAMPRRSAFPLVAMPAARRPPPRPCPPPWPLSTPPWPPSMPSLLLPGRRVASAAWTPVLARVSHTEAAVGCSCAHVGGPSADNALCAVYHSSAPRVRCQGSSTAIPERPRAAKNEQTRRSCPATGHAGRTESPAPVGGRTPHLPTTHIRLYCLWAEII